MTRRALVLMTILAAALTPALPLLAAEREDREADNQAAVNVENKHAGEAHGHMETPRDGHLPTPPQP